MAKRATSSKPRQSKKSPKSASASKRTTKKAKKSTTKRAPSAESAGEQECAIDRRRSDRRNEAARETPSTAPERPKLERRKKVNRRRQIDPTTCERDYSQDEIEFMSALDEYKRANGRMFPTCSEVLEVIRSLGYVKLSPTEKAHVQADKEPSPTPTSHDEEDEFGEEMAAMAMSSGEQY